MLDDLQKPLVYIGEKPAELCIVTPLPVIANYAEEIARDMGIRTCIALTQVYSDVRVAEQLVNNGAIKLIATRGYTEYVMRRQSLVPVLSMDYSAEIFLETLLPLQKSNLVVGHLCMPGQGLKFNRVAKLLGITGYRLEVEDRENLEQVLKDAVVKKINLLVGGIGLITSARKRGFKCLPITTETRETVYTTFADAKSILDRWRINESQHHFIKTVLDISPNIIIHINPQLIIRYANNAARKQFGSINAKLTGQKLITLFPQIEPATFLSDASLKEESVIEDVLHREFLCQMEPVPVQTGEEGYILVLSKVEDIQKKEREVRQSNYNKFAFPTSDVNMIIGKSKSIQTCKSLALKFAACDEPVLIFGETGTGKELFAQAIHTHGKRSSSRFVSLNCASLSENLLESELFGYEEGAFTSARRGGKPGLLELANGGTIFLDEMAEMTPAVQGKLLRVLQDKIITRLGSTRFLPVNIRIICATNKNLLTLVNEGKFRKDLFYRINTLILPVPNLAERLEDIPVLACHYLDQKGASCSGAVLNALKKRSWPGNVRELLHVLDRALVMAKNKRIEEKDLVFDDQLLQQDPTSSQKTLLQQTLITYKYNRKKTARAMGISRTTLWKLMKMHELLGPEQEDCKSIFS